MKKTETERIEKRAEEALLKEKTNPKTGELRDADLEKLSGGRRMTTGDIIKS